TKSLSFSKYVWGRFNIKLSGRNFAFRVIELLMNKRSCLTGIATGDQAIFIEKNMFLEIKGFPEIPLMEDIEICKKLKQYSKPACIKDRVISSSRRWEENGILRTVLLMWSIRLAWFFGVSAERLKKIYYA
ncbi:MAG: glycosyl transferase, partial [Gammaproteobacteria bacterium]|nr:glycosyl transferase [Gammaproteobacteria bacterium]